MTFEDEWKKEKDNHLGDYSWEVKEYDLKCAFKAGYIIKHKACLDKQNKEAVCEQASKFGMIHSQTVKDVIVKYKCTCSKYSLSQCVRCNILEDLGME